MKRASYHTEIWEHKNFPGFQILVSSMVVCGRHGFTMLDGSKGFGSISGSYLDAFYRRVPGTRVEKVC